MLTILLVAGLVAAATDTGRKVIRRAAPCAGRAIRRGSARAARRGGTAATGAAGRRWAGRQHGDPIVWRADRSNADTDPSGGAHTPIGDVPARTVTAPSVPSVPSVPGAEQVLATDPVPGPPTTVAPDPAVNPGPAPAAGQQPPATSGADGHVNRPGDEHFAKLTARDTQTPRRQPQQPPRGQAAGRHEEPNMSHSTGRHGTRPTSPHAPAAAPNGIHVAEYTPESMSELLQYCGQMSRANQSMSEATAEFLGTLVAEIGLDSQAVAGLEAIADQYAEVADAWQQAGTQIRSRYEQVIEAVESGVQLPHQGRFIDGDAA